MELSDIVVMGDSDTRDELVPLLENEFSDANVLGQSSVTLHINVKGRWGRNNVDDVKEVVADAGYDATAVNTK